MGKRDKILADHKGKLVKPTFGFTEYHNSTMMEFSFSREEIIEYDDIHSLTAHLANSCRQAIVSGDFTLLENMFRFTANILTMPEREVDSEIINSFYISFLYDEDFKESKNGSKAWVLVPEQLKEIIKKAT